MLRTATAPVIVAVNKSDNAEARAGGGRVPRPRLARDAPDQRPARPRGGRPARRRRLGAAARSLRRSIERKRLEDAARGRRRACASRAIGPEAIGRGGRLRARRPAGAQWRSSAGPTSARARCSTRCSARSARSSATSRARRATRSTPRSSGPVEQSGWWTLPASGAGARSRPGRPRSATRRSAR